MMALCPDPRGPLVDREDFLEGQIDALVAMQRAYHESVGEILHDPQLVEVRLTLDSSFTGNTAIDQYAADLDCAAMDVGTTIDQALQSARWKLGKVKRGEVLP